MLPENIRLSNNLAEGLQAFFNENSFSKIAVLVDENTLEHCYPIVAPLLKPHICIEIKSGEENKTLATCEHIWQQLTDHEFDRNALFINLGGGVIGDMGGFCASAYKRGIAFINLPTTLLSQVDASIGGKLGIDFGVYKNHIGFFKEPMMVFVNPDFLSTLPKREVKSGFAEIIKHSLIADSDYWDRIKAIGFEGQDWSAHIKHSLETKYKIVQEDPYEKGLRKILNFGHTIGHAIESYFLKIPNRKLLHGEAIAIGMICEAYLSYKKLGLSAKALDKIAYYIVQNYGKPTIREEEIAQIIALLAQDKKNNQNQVKASLLEEIGRCGFDIAILPEEAKESILFYLNQT